MSHGANLYMHCHRYICADTPCLYLLVADVQPLWSCTYLLCSCIKTYLGNNSTDQSIWYAGVMYLVWYCRNRNDAVWHIFTSHKDPNRPIEEYKLDLHTPDIYRFPKNGKPSEFLSSRDAAYAAEHWMLTMQEHNGKSLFSHTCCFADM